MEAGRKNVLLVPGLILSMFTIMVPGLEMAFNIYALSLKETFNFTQTQVEITGSVGTFGLALTFLENTITTHFGYKATFLTTWIATPLSSGLISLAAVYGTFFHNWPVLIYLLQLLFSTSNSMTWMIIARVNLEAFPKNHSAKVIGVVYAMSCSGKIVFASIINIFFKHSLSGFFLTVSVASAILLGVTYAVLLKIISMSNNTEYAEQTSCGKIYSSLDSSPEQVSVENDKEVPFKDVLRSASFHLTFWPSALFAACGFTLLNNITSIAESAGFMNVMATVYLISSAIIITRVSFGIIFDQFQSLACGFILLMTSYASLAIASALGMYSLDVVNMYVITVLVGIGLGGPLSISLSILVLRFGQKHFSPISYLLFPVLAIFQTLLQVFTGFSYDTEISIQDTGVRHCHGGHCFFWCFLAMLIIIAMVVVVQCLNRLISFLSSDKEMK